MQDIDVVNGIRSDALSKVPMATLAFWIAKIIATTLGETGGDALSMSANLGYAISSLILLAFFLVTVTAQILAKRFHAALYWMVVVATTTVGTTTSDYLDRTLGLGYVKSSIALFCAVIAILAAWKLSTGAIAVDQVKNRKDEGFYWLTILVSNTLGTALGDFAATTTGLGFEGGTLLFASLIGLVALAHFFTRLPAAILFWAAYVLTRPLGATLGDTLTKAPTQGGLGLSRVISSLALVFAMILAVAWASRAKRRRGNVESPDGLRPPRDYH
jgi:uncharacterized membrane-anchored protein